jgi:DNA-binding response OmpR family regulator
MTEALMPKKKILVAEDDRSILQIITITLTKGGLHVLGAKDGEEALHLALKELPDAIILDIQMPKIDGLTLCKKLKANERTAHIPVGFLTAQLDNNSYAQGMKIGGLLYMPKPFNPDRLNSFVQLLLAASQMP